MRGVDGRSGELFSYVDLEDRVPAQHPLRGIRSIVNEVLAALDGEFSKLYADTGRSSIPPERLLRALLLQAFYTIRSERQLMEQLDYNLLYRWFVGLGVDEPVWVATVFSKNRDRLLDAEVARKFMAELLNHEKVRKLLSDEHFSVDGTQIQAWASMKSFRAKDGSDNPPDPGRNGERDFRGEKPSNERTSCPITMRTKCAPRCLAPTSSQAGRDRWGCGGIVWSGADRRDPARRRRTGHDGHCAETRATCGSPARST
jgi:transposase